MHPRSSSETARWIVLAASIGGLALAGLAPASCTLDADGKAPASPGPGGGGPGTGGDGTTSSTATSGGGQGGTGGTSPEDCFDGVDNDTDGNADCADTDCTPAVECVDAAPDGSWTGGVRVVRVPYPAVDPLPECADGSAPVVYYSGPAGPAQCSACGCTFAGASCTSPLLECWFDSTNCMGSVDLTDQTTTSNCVSNPAPPASGNGSCGRTAPAQVASPGTCEAPGGQVMNPTTWAEEVYVCATLEVQAGCGQGQVCVPKTPAGFDSTICVTKEEEVAGCPAGWTDVEIQGFQSGTDTRVCEGCACDTSAVTCSGGSISIYDLDSCQGVGANLVSSCADVGGYLDNDSFSYRGFPGMPSQGTCTEATPTGEVQTQGPQHICCKNIPVN